AGSELDRAPGFLFLHIDSDLRVGEKPHLVSFDRRYELHLDISLMVTSMVRRAGFLEPDAIAFDAVDLADGAAIMADHNHIPFNPESLLVHLVLRQSRTGSRYRRYRRE